MMLSLKNSENKGFLVFHDYSTNWTVNDSYWVLPLHGSNKLVAKKKAAMFFTVQLNSWFIELQKFIRGFEVVAFVVHI